MLLSEGFATAPSAAYIVSLRVTCLNDVFKTLIHSGTKEADWSESFETQIQLISSKTDTFQKKTSDFINESLSN